MEPKEHVEAVRKGYDLGAHVYASSWTEPHPWLEEERKRFLSEVKANGTLLDVGCGPGRDSDYWKSQGLDVLGIDNSPKMIELARMTYPEINFKVLPIFDVESLGRNFDYIWASYVLLHIP
jgi:2-polyprenyl-3-methyl-5-hydroxy-6-metoxy-1,4-benzoquinol methylase